MDTDNVLDDGNEGWGSDADLDDEGHHLQGPTFLNCVVFMIVFAILNIAVVLYFARQLKPDKEESKCGIAQ